MELREKKEALRKKFSKIDNDYFEVPNDWGSTDPTLNYTHWLENIILESPKHETVEQWEKRTGESYPDDGAVYIFEKDFIYEGNDLWMLEEYGKVKDDYSGSVVANHHGKPEV